MKLIFFWIGFAQAQITHRLQRRRDRRMIDKYYADAEKAALTLERLRAAHHKAICMMAESRSR